MEGLFSGETIPTTTYHPTKVQLEINWLPMYKILINQNAANSGVFTVRAELLVWFLPVLVLRSDTLHGGQIAVTSQATGKTEKIISHLN